MLQDLSNQFQPSEQTAPKGDEEDDFWQDPFCSQEPASYSGM